MGMTMQFIKRYRTAIFLFLITFLISIVVMAQIAPRMVVLNNDAIVNDQNANGLADAGDVIRYTVTIANCEGDTAQGVRFNSLISDLLSLLPGSVNISFGPATLEVCGTLPEATDPADPADPVPPVSVDASATDDSFSVTNGGTNTEDVLANDAGDALLTVVSFGDSLANVGVTPADGATILSIAAGGGTVDITIDATGNIDITASGTTGSGSVSIFYELQAGNGTTDTAQVDITYGDFPTAQDDTLATLGAGNEYTTDANVTLNVPAGTGLLNNDTLGNPAGTLVNWGGGDASAAVTVAPSASRPFAGGTLTVNADGSFDLVNPTTSGIYTFDYILDNGIGSSQATVELYVAEMPTAQNDSLEAIVGQITNFPASTLFNDNGSGADNLGSPPAVVDFFGGGSFGGAVGDNGEGASVTIPVLGGDLTINADGSLTVDTPTLAGTFTVEYQITNSAGSSVGTVTVDIVQTPTTADDDFTILLGNNLSGDVTADNGNGVDNPGTPPFTSLTFGAGDLGGTVTSNAGGSSVTLAGGTLTVNNDGTFTLNGATTTGSYTFQYELTNTNGTSASATVTIEIQEAPTAQDDNPAPPTYQVTLTNTLTIPVGANDLLQNADPNGADSLGFPNATITSFGVACNNTLAGTPGATDTSAGLTVNGDGSFSYTPTVLGTGTHTFCYTLSNGVAPASTANVTILVVEGPTANDDAFSFRDTSDQTTPNTLFVDNGNGADNLGTPTATVTSFGGGDSAGVLGTTTAGSTVTIAGGNLTVNTDGTWTLTGQPFTPGQYTFDYRLDNGLGTSDATVTLNVLAPPTAVDDGAVGSPAYTVALGNSTTTTVAAGVVQNNDDYTLPNVYPDAVVALVEASAPNTPVAIAGSGGVTVSVAPDGALTINATAGGAIAGDYSFSYTISNTLGIPSTADVYFRVTEGPIANDDTFTVQFDDASPVINGDLTANNGAAVDTAGSPPFTTLTFGGGDLGGAITDNTATAGGTSVSLAGGTNNLTIFDDGTITLTSAGTLTPGQYTFSYRLDNGVATNDATVTINIQAPPTAVADSISVNLGASTGLVAAASGLRNTNDDWTLPNVYPNATIAAASNTSNADALTIGVPYAIPVTGGTLTINADGSYTLDATTATSGGTFNFEYTLSNAAGSDTASLTVIIDAPPTVTSTTPTDTATNIASDSDIVINFSESVTVGPLGISVTGSTNGAYSIFTSSSGSSYTFSTTTDFAPGETVTVTLNAAQVEDTDGSPTQLDGNGDGTAGDNYTFTFTIDEQPSVLSVQVEKSDTLGDITVGTNDTDVDLDTTIVVNFSENVFGTGEWITLDCDSSGTYNQMGTGTSGVAIVVTPSLSGTTSTATISRASGTFAPAETCTITIGASSINDSDAIDPPANMASDYSDTFTLINQIAPTANDDGTFTVAVGGSLNAPADTLFNDSGSGADDRGLPQADIASFGGGDTLAPTDATDHPAGTTDTLAGGTLQVNADGSFSLANPTTPGTYTFLYRLTNAAGSSDATVTIEVRQAPDGNDDSSAAVLAGTSSPSDAFHVALNAPSAVIGNLYVDNGGFGADILGNPSAPTSAPLDIINNVTLAGTPVAGSNAIGNGNVPFGGDGVINIAANGDLTFEPPTSFTGLVTFQYTLANSVGTDATPATVTVAVGDRPACTVDGYTGTANIGFSVNAASGILANDSGDSITVTQAMGGAGNVGNPVATTNGGTVTLNADGSFDYEPPAGVSGVNADSFTYAISNGFGEVTTNCTANITLNDDAGAVAWFINASGTSANLGTFQDPFTSIAAFNAVNNNTGNNPGDGDVVYIYEAGDPYNEADGVNTLDGQEFYGGTVQFNTVYTASGLVSSAYTTFASSPESSNRTEIRTTGDDAFDIFSNNAIQGFVIDSTASYAFADSGVDIGTTNISDVSTFNNGGVFNLQNGGTINATLDRMSANIPTASGLSVIRLNGISGTITDTTPGGIVHQESSNVFDIRNSPVSVTVSSSVTKTSGTGTSIYLDNADGTYNFSGFLDILSGTGGVNIVNGSDGTLNDDECLIQLITNTHGIPFRINNSAMNVTYNGNITHQVRLWLAFTARH
jgi:hypothetical protein